MFVNQYTKERERTIEWETNEHELQNDSTVACSNTLITLRQTKETTIQQLLESLMEALQ